MRIPVRFKWRESFPGADSGSIDPSTALKKQTKRSKGRAPIVIQKKFAFQPKTMQKNTSSPDYYKWLSSI
jgi:hypothetical protein